MKTEGIHVILRKSKDGQFYGITYVDHVTNSVFNGSSLGKQFSAKGILESCEQNISNYEKHYQKSILFSSGNTQNLESGAHLKTYADNILLRVENTNDYVRKQGEGFKKSRGCIKFDCQLNIKKNKKKR